MSLFEELQHQMALIPAIQALPCEQTFKRVAETAELSVYRDEKGEWLFHENLNKKYAFYSDFDKLCHGQAV